MEIEITETKENPLLNRFEYTGKVHHKGEPTPSRADLRSKLAANVNKDEDLLVLIECKTEYGWGVSNVVFHCYDSSEDLLSIEKKYILKRNKLLEEEA